MSSGIVSTRSRRGEGQSSRGFVRIRGDIRPACFRPAAAPARAAKSGPKILTAIGSVGGSYTQNMSPFSPNANLGTDGLLYENLVYVNGLTGQETPMLATGHSWSADNLTLTFTIRQGVKWSDGQAFSANDVAFTFNMLKQYPQADGSGLWQHFASVTAPDANTVVITLQSPAPTMLPFIEQTYIVPQHIWQSVGDPTKFQTRSRSAPAQ